jgi:hypothetical protein
MHLFVPLLLSRVYPLLQLLTHYTYDVFLTWRMYTPLQAVHTVAAVHVLQFELQGEHTWVLVSPYVDVGHFDAATHDELDDT